jgi:hypothetical protein
MEAARVLFAVRGAVYESPLGPLALRQRANLIEHLIEIRTVVVHRALPPPRTFIMAPPSGAVDGRVAPNGCSGLMGATQVESS